MSEKKIKRYKQKVRQGLVPHVYDRNSRSFREGAWKNWPNRRDRQNQIEWTQSPEDRDIRADKQLLELGRK